MKKILVVYNPRSSRFKDVEAGVFEKVRAEKGVLVGKFEVQPTTPTENAEKLAEIIQGGELVLTAGGDGTATIGMNGVILAREKFGKEAVFSAVAYGGFNDLPRALGELETGEVLRKFKAGEESEFYPLEVKADGKHIWYPAVYFTMGMMAESIKVFEEPKVRKQLRTGKKGIFFSGRKLFCWYLKNKRKKFLEEFSLLKTENIIKKENFNNKTSDYVAMNGVTMAKMIKIPRSSGGKRYFQERESFWSGAEKFGSFLRLLRVGFFQGFLRGKIPGGETRGDLIKFKKPARVFLHAEGEGRELRGVSEVLVKKIEKPIRVIRIERKK